MDTRTGSMLRGYRTWVAVAVLGGCLAGWPGRASAQPVQKAPDWEVNITPLYLWASEMDGSMVLGDRDIPIFMDFGTAVSRLSGIFTFAGDARKGRWGVFGDLGFVRLGTDATFTLRPSSQVPRTVAGHLDLDNVIFEAGGSLLLAHDVSVLGGIRTYTFNPNITLTGTTLDAVDVRKTNVDGFGGFTYRPRLSPRWSLLTRADIGAGESDFTWSGLVAVEFRMKSFAGLLVGYKALGIDTGDTFGGNGGPVSMSAVPTAYEVTHYGPVVAGTFHWGR